jgi:hypothetical protein
MIQTKFVRQMAHHEAAHAVTALHLGFSVDWVHIVEDDDYMAQTCVTVPAPNGEGKKYISTIFNDAVVDLAGNVVDFKFDNPPNRPTVDFISATEKLTFYVLAKQDVILPYDYLFIEQNRMTRELFDEWRVEKPWKRIKGNKRLGNIFAKAETRAKVIVDERWPSVCGATVAEAKTQRRRNTIVVCSVTLIFFHEL